MAAPGQLETYGGGGNGENLPAVDSAFPSPAGIASDDAGNIYIADREAGRVKVISPDGTTRTIAGTGAVAFNGDGGPATGAALRYPSDVAISTAGDIFIADTENHRIRRIDNSGTITTVAGGGVIPVGAADGQPGTSVELRYPYAVESLSNGSIAFANSGGHSVMSINSAGTLRVIAGTGSRGSSGDGGPASAAKLNFPQGLADSGDGNLFVADSMNSTVRKIDASGVITRIAGGGIDLADDIPATQAVLRFPTALHFSDGKLLIADSESNRVRSIGVDGVIRLVAGSGSYCTELRHGSPADQACLARPTGVLAHPDGSVLISAPRSMRVVRVRDNNTLFYAGNGTGAIIGDGLPARKALIMEPRGLAMMPNGALLIAETQRGRVRRIDPNGVITTIAGTTPGFSGDGGPATAAQLHSPYGVVVGTDGSIYIADAENGRVRRIAPDGIITTVAGGGPWSSSTDGKAATSVPLWGPTDLAIGPDGMLYIAERGASRIRRVDANGIITTVAGSGNWGSSGDGGRAIEARFSYPTSLDFNSKGEMFIADSLNNRIRKVAVDGTISTVAGSGLSPAVGAVPSMGSPASLATLNNPTSVRVDGMDRILIADTNSHQIRLVDGEGKIWTVAGGPLYDDSYGDGKDAKMGHLHYPAGLAIDINGNLYISDSDPTHWLIRRVEGPLA